MQTSSGMDSEGYPMRMNAECGSVEELRAVDSNLSSLCQHIQSDGWHSGSFSDIVIECLGATFKLHRLVLSRSSYFSHMLQGPWEEANASEVTLRIDDENIDREAVSIALSYLYGHYPKLNDHNAFRVLAAASFLDLQDLCAICTDFIISEIWSSNFLIYQAFAERQDYGVHGDRVRKACWGYLCKGGAVELREILPKLSTQTLCHLLTSDELWVPSEEKRFELALEVFLSKACLLDVESSSCSNSSLLESCLPEDSSSENESDRYADNLDKDMVQGKEAQLVSKHTSLHKNLEKEKVASEILVELADCVVDGYDLQKLQLGSTDSKNGVHYCQNSGMTLSPKNNPTKSQIAGSSYSQPQKIRMGMNASRSTDTSLSELNTIITEKLSGNQTQNSSLAKSSLEAKAYPNNWGTCNSHTPSWGGRIVSRRQIKAYPKESDCNSNVELEALLNVFESGGILYCQMTFDGLLDVRKKLEELGFACKSVYDALWLQMLLRQQVLAVAGETCKNCCQSRQLCGCRSNYDMFSHGRTNENYYRDDQQRLSGVGSVGSLYAGEASGTSVSSVPPRVRVRTTIDGLAGIGRGTNFASQDVAWPPTRVVFSRVPYGLGGRNNQHNLVNEQSEVRLDLGEAEFPRDGLTVAVGLGQGYGNGIPVHTDQTPRVDDQHTHGRTVRDGSSATSSGNNAMQRTDAQDHHAGREWETTQESPIALDLQTPLCDFPPFRFGVEFEDVQRLGDGQAKHSQEVFYAGSLWKVSVQAFNDEDPQGRRTLGLFLHRRKAENGDALQKVHLYADTREKVKVRYQLICPSKRQVMVFGSLAQSGTLLPKAPKGWGWRTALLFDELPDLLQGGSLRVAAVIQIV